MKMSVEYMAVDIDQTLLALRPSMDPTFIRSVHLRVHQSMHHFLVTQTFHEGPVGEFSTGVADPQAGMWTRIDLVIHDGYGIRSIQEISAFRVQGHTIVAEGN